MSVTTIGDMAWQFGSMRRGSAIKSDLAQLSASLSSGRVSDVTSHLNGETGRFTAINHSLAQLAAFGLAARETDQLLSVAQTSLGQFDELRGQLTAQLLLVADHSTTAQVDQAATSARGALDVLVAVLNTRVADRAIFGGQDVNNTPVIRADEMISQIVTAIGPDRTFDGIAAVIEAWFDDPAGGYATTGYRGDTGPMLQRRISDSARVEIAARADDPAIRDVLKAAVLLAVSTELPGLGADAKRTLAQEAASGLFESASGVTQLQARIGTAQQKLSEAMAEMSAQETGFRMAVNDLISADPFDTATRLQSVQLQLETHYTVVGRMSQLSLLRFI